jgi:hypothetical protein
MGQAASDQHTLMVRRRAAFGGGLVLLILIILLIGGCLKSRKQQALETYNQRVGQIIEESDQQVSHPFFSALSGASTSTPLNVELNIDQLRAVAQREAASAQGLSVPDSMQAPQRNLLLALDLRTEGLTKIAALVRTALGGQDSNSATQIAGDMEMFLASDVIYSQRVAPLIEQTLSSSGVSSQTVAKSQFLPNLGWLDTSTVEERLTGQASSSSSSNVAPGTHGHALKGVSVGSTELQPETLNHITGAPNVTFAAMVENGGENVETNVKVNVIVKNSASEHKVPHIIEKTEPGKTVRVDIPVEGISPGLTYKVTVEVAPVPGESNVENNKLSYEAVFEK